MSKTFFDSVKNNRERNSCKKCEKSCKCGKPYTYNKIPEEEIQAGSNEISELFTRFCNGVKDGLYEEEDYVKYTYVLDEIILRMDRRTAYYNIFNSYTVNELKTLALLVYWILKLKPYHIKEDKIIRLDVFLRRSSEVNERFAAFLVFNMLVDYGRINKSEILKVQYQESYEKFRKELIYSFRYRCFTIESMIMLMESITTESITKYREIKQ